MKKVTALLIIPLLVTNCTTVNRIHDRDISLDSLMFVKQNFPEEHILQISDLANDTKEVFEKLSTRKEPGLVCGKHKANVSGCAVLLAKNGESPVSTRILYITKSGGSFSTELIEDFTKEKTLRTNVFLLPKEKMILKNVGEGPSEIPMENIGVARVIDGQSAMVFFYQNGKFNKVWIAD